MNSSFSDSISANLTDQEARNIAHAILFWGHADILLGSIYSSISFATDDKKETIWCRNKDHSDTRIKLIKHKMKDHRFLSSAVGHLNELFACYVDYKLLRNDVSHGFLCTSPAGDGFLNGKKGYVAREALGLVEKQAKYTVDLAYSIVQHLASNGRAPLVPLGTRPPAS